MHKIIYVTSHILTYLTDITQGEHGHEWQMNNFNSMFPWKQLNFEMIPLNMVLWYYIIIGLDNGLAPIGCQAII